MPDHDYVDPGLAALYDAFNPREISGDFEFYLPMIMAANSVLDVGCGTGSLLHWARESGHQGRLVGLDPAEAMLAQARRRDDVEWVLGDLSTATWDSEFDFAVMTGHAFQVLLTDDELRTAFAAIRRALKPGGRFGFDTRDPAARGWERWTSAHVSEVVTADGITVRSWNEAGPFENGYVSFTTTYESPAWDAPQYSESTLRFLDVPSLGEFIAEAGLVVDEQYGHWDRRPAGPEIITIVRRP
ncbi:ubiquinone/menaquinone biosynthesis C-methylase UbiE [Amycolatopsis lexingtonensis]|uniref:Ubiquinone/menaquinone biosynthesis C-methylase UbiE n=1 Tax=Amycolatopsis lexingtonensis TaxID=218822 RepID=A0ABR9I7A9_9PSEU|nr:class I SAM-dependent methyltransferase [Amycolatopsis lexingtonensis]MBE1498847.1 ubiquinone/menaquinone biosynthesis C-methylase UbiE [Amycolatopsis lexingtonensis]